MGRRCCGPRVAGSLWAGGLGPAGAEQMVPVGGPAGSWSCKIFCQCVGPPEEKSHIHAGVTTHIRHTQETRGCIQCP